MALDESARALRAKLALAIRHAEEQRRKALEQRARAKAQLEAERRIVEAVRARPVVDSPTVRCVRCRGIWLTDEVRQATRRRFGCPLCGGRLTSVP